MKKAKKWISVMVLAFFMLTIIDFPVLAEVLTDEDGYIYADSLTWNIEQGVLTFSGTGEMRDYAPPTYTPWGQVGNIKKVVLQDGITSIGTWAFGWENQLVDVELPNSIVKIKEYAFRGCNNLEEITLPDSVQEIGIGAFWDCHWLQEIEIPNNVSKIEPATFKNCYALRKVVIPENVVEIAEDVFEDPVNVTIYGYTGSYAETYAQKYNIPFVSLSSEDQNITTIQFDKDTYSCPINDTVRIQANISYSKGEPQDEQVQWFVGDNKVVQILETPPTGVETEKNVKWLKGLKEGSTNVTVRTTDGTSATVNVDVTTTAPGELRMEFYTGNDSQSVMVGDTILVGVGVFQGDKRLQDVSNITFVAENESKLRVEHVIVRDGYVFASVRGLQKGISTLEAVDEAHGLSLKIAITVSDETGNVYTVANVPEQRFTNIWGKEEIVNFYDFNGMYIDHFTATETADHKATIISMDVYNERYIHGVVEVYDKNGHIKNCAVIEKFNDPTSIKSIVWDDGIYSLIKEGVDGDLLTYQQEIGAKHTPIQVEVPKGGYIRITNNGSKAFFAGLLNCVDLAISTGSVVEGVVKVWNSDTSLLVSKAIVQKELIELQNKLISEQYLETTFAKEAMKEVSLNATSMGSFADSLIASAQSVLTEEELAKILMNTGISATEGIFMKLTGAFGQAIQGIISLQKYGNVTLGLAQYSGALRSGVIEIQVPENGSLNTNGWNLTYQNGVLQGNLKKTALEVFQSKLSSNEESKIASKSGINLNQYPNAVVYNTNLLQDGEQVELVDRVTMQFANPWNTADSRVRVKGLYRINDDYSLTEISLEQKDDLLTYQTDQMGRYLLLGEETNQNPGDKPSSSGSGSYGGSSSGGFTGTYNYPVKADSTGDATVTLDKNDAVAGDKVTITVKPNAGKAVDEVIVTDADNKVLTVTKVGDNKYSFTMPSSAVKVAVTTKAATYDKRIVLQVGNRNVRINDTTFANDVAPVIVDNRTMVPIRVVTEALGGRADWDGAIQTVTLTIEGNVLRMAIGQTIPGFDAAPVILNSRTYVPIRYVAEKLGATVEWIAKTQQIIIEK